MGLYFDFDKPVIEFDQSIPKVRHAKEQMTAYDASLALEAEFSKLYNRGWSHAYAFWYAYGREPYEDFARKRDAGLCPKGYPM